ncbi:MAG TPA: tripartite tricarboxylate transporter substrate binding protein [Burkholderiales bacterium]
MRIFLRLVAAVLICLPGIGSAAYPERPITMIVAFSPGGGTDVVARALVPYLEKHIGGNAKIVILNRAGAGGDIGFAALAAAPPDGYTIGFVNSPSFLALPLERPTKYTWQSFDLLGNVVDDPASFAVHADSAIKNLADLAAFAKANPGALSVGTPGVGSPGHLASTMFGKLAGVVVNHIPFKGAGEVRAPLAGKQVVLGAISIGESFQAIKGGVPLRILAQLSAARTTLAPDLATATEQGFPLVLSSLRGVAGPKGLPADIRERLAKALERAVADPEFQAKSLQYYAPLRYLSPAQFEATLREDDAQIRLLWKDTPWADK